MIPHESDAKEERASSKVLRSWQENLILIAIALCLAFLIRTFIAEPRGRITQADFSSLRIPWLCQYLRSTRRSGFARIMTASITRRSTRR